MAVNPGQHQAAAVTVPISGDALSSNTVKATQNATVDSYNDHDNDGTIHVQSGSLAQRPAVAPTDTIYLTTDSPRRIYVYNTSGWEALDYASSGPAQPDQKFYLFATRI